MTDPTPEHKGHNGLIGHRTGCPACEAGRRHDDLLSPGPTFDCMLREALTVDPTPEPTGPQPVPDAYRCGDLDDEWEVLENGAWVSWRRSGFSQTTIRRARRKAPPLTPREGDAVETASGYVGRVVASHGDYVCVQGDVDLRVARTTAYTVTDRPPKRPVRVWLTDEQVAEGAEWSALNAVRDACRALVDEG